jgi:hypothetical protein
VVGLAARFYFLTGHQHLPCKALIGVDDLSCVVWWLMRRCFSGARLGRPKVGRHPDTTNLGVTKRGHGQCEVFDFQYIIVLTVLVSLLPALVEYVGLWGLENLGNSTE